MGLVGAVGIEPTTFGLKDQNLTQPLQSSTAIYREISHLKHSKLLSSGVVVCEYPHKSRTVRGVVAQRKSLAPLPPMLRLSGSGIGRLLTWSLLHVDSQDARKRQSGLMPLMARTRRPNTATNSSRKSACSIQTAHGRNCVTANLAVGVKALEFVSSVLIAKTGPEEVWQ